VEFARIDPTNDDQFNAWFGVLQRSETLRNKGNGDGWHPSEWRARALDDTAPIFHQLFSFGLDVLHPVAVGSLEVTQVDNLHWIRGDLFVDPSERRKGYGSTLLTHLEAAARNHNRQSILFWVIEGGDEVGQGPNRAFASRHGYDVVEENIRRDLTWPRPEGELDALWEQWMPFAKDYDIVSWTGPTPDDFVNDRAHLFAVMPIEVPDAGFDIEEELWTAERVRQHERRTNEMGRDLLVAAALHRDTGRLAGFSELTVSREQPGTAYQWDTLVLRSHRGHRLGGLMRITTMRLLTQGNYQTRRINTSNNSVNTHMIKVNENLGARVSGGIVTWRKSLL
jgi:GNAT superfamily N-acetyltransferase